MYPVVLPLHVPSPSFTSPPNHKSPNQSHPLLYHTFVWLKYTWFWDNLCIELLFLCAVFPTIYLCKVPMNCTPIFYWFEWYHFQKSINNTCSLLTDCFPQHHITVFLCRMNTSDFGHLNNCWYDFLKSGFIFGYSSAIFNVASAFKFGDKTNRKNICTQSKITNFSLVFQRQQHFGKNLTIQKHKFVLWTNIEGVYKRYEHLLTQMLLSTDHCHPTISTSLQNIKGVYVLYGAPFCFWRS